MDYNDSPDYLKAADLHNLGSGTPSFFDDPIENISQKVGSAANFVYKIPAFALTSVASGVNSIYNSGVVAGNFFGLTDAKENDLQSTLASYDTDLGKYYGEHKNSVDLAGFLVGSFVPGMAGVKLINTGQRALSGAMKSGTVGRTLAESVGVIQTADAAGMSLTQVAAASLAEGGQAFTVFNAGVVKALASGVGQAAIDSVGFEAMVQATMFRSPILQDQDFKDIGSNLLTAAVFGGVVGGVLNSAKVYGGITKELDRIDAKQFPAKVMNPLTGELSDSQKIILRADDVSTAAKITDPELIALATKKAENARLDIRVSVNKLSDDTTVGNQVADIFDTLQGDQIASAISGVTRISPASRKGLATAEGQERAYVKIHGLDGVGDMTFDKLPRGALNLTSRLEVPVGSNVKDVVTSKVLSFKFSTEKPWSMNKASGMDEIEARYIWADKHAVFNEGMTIHMDDIALLEGAALRDLQKVTLVGDNGIQVASNGADILKELEKTKLRVATEIKDLHPNGFIEGTEASQVSLFGGKLLEDGTTTGRLKAPKITSVEIARAVNTDVRALESESSASFFARQDAQEAMNKGNLAIGKKEIIDLDYAPQFIRVDVDATRAAAQTPDMVSALVNVRQQQVINREATDRAAAVILGDLESRTPASFMSRINEASRSGAGAGIISSSNANSFTLGSTIEYIGKTTHDLISQTKKRTSDIVDSVALRLRNDQAAAIEFSNINDLRNKTTEKYVLNANEDGLILRSLDEYNKKIAAGEKNVLKPVPQEGAPEEILFKSELAGEAIIADMSANGYRVEGMNGLRKAQGIPTNADPSIFYGWKPDEKSMPFFAFVKDESLTGTAAGQTSMIHAATADQLQEMINLVHKIPGYKAYTKAETEKFFKAKKEYEFDRSLHENYMDPRLKSAGVNNQFFPKTDANAITDEWLAHHSKRDTILARETISTKYADEFNVLHSLGEQYTNVASSQKGVTVRGVENAVKNPYQDYIKTALDISKMSEYPLLEGMNRGLEKATGYVIQSIADAYQTVKLSSDLPRINKMLEDAGISHAYGKAAEVVLANHSAPTPYLSNFVRSANSILAATFLKLDFLNPIANAVGSQVLLGHETNGQIKQALRDASRAGITVPGTTESILSVTKMIAKANKSFITGDEQLKTLFKRNGLTTTYQEQMISMLDDLALRGSETPAQLNSLLQRALDKSKQLTEVGARVTGNNLAEEYNRYVAAHVATQIHDVRMGLKLATAEDLGPFMNTFVNRTQTNTLASQRPVLFQGPVGQAIGLFQSFQFNTMQQLFKSVAEGGAKDTAMLLGLQGTIFGLNGLPGFQYINQHIVGTASGNPKHTDAYSTLYGAAGKEAGDWLMYGIPSNMLQTNLYSRGDINPRQLTVVPVAPQDIVAVSAFAKFASNIKETLGKIAGGGDIYQSVLQGLEHNGISRPLAGLATTLQAADNPYRKVFSTTNSGDISFVNDFMSLATISRLAGGKPLDEALANDQVSRTTVYQAADRARMKGATELFKSSIIGHPDDFPPTEAVKNYVGAYVRNGGKPENFNKEVLHVLTQVNTPKANKIIEAMKDPGNQRMKELLGGSVESLKD